MTLKVVINPHKYFKPREFYAFNGDHSTKEGCLRQLRLIISRDLFIQKSRKKRVFGFNLVEALFREDDASRFEPLLNLPNWFGAVLHALAENGPHELAGDFAYDAIAAIPLRWNPEAALWRLYVREVLPLHVKELQHMAEKDLKLLACIEVTEQAVRQRHIPTSAVVMAESLSYRLEFNPDASFNQRRLARLLHEFLLPVPQRFNPELLGGDILNVCDLQQRMLGLVQAAPKELPNGIAA